MSDKTETPSTNKESLFLTPNRIPEDPDRWSINHTSEDCVRSATHDSTVKSSCGSKINSASDDVAYPELLLDERQPSPNFGSLVSTSSVPCDAHSDPALSTSARSEEHTS